MPIRPAEYENGREGAFITGVLIPYLDTLEERMVALEKQPVVVTTPKAVVTPTPSVTKPTIRKSKKTSVK